MLFNTIQHSQAVDARLAIASEAGTTWGALRDESVQLVSALSGMRNKRVGVCSIPSAPTVATLAALDALGTHTVLLDERFAAGGWEQFARQLGLDAVLVPGDRGSHIEALEPVARVSNVPGGVTILTSGTEGMPKPVTHSWESLARPVRAAAASHQRWLLTFRLNLYAGLQVLLQSLLNFGTLVTLPSDASPDEVVARMLRYDVNHASATPSYWRRLLLFADRANLARVPLRQITLGGEIVDQQVLDDLKRLYPTARIVHIYATTELGRCFSVADGQAGFPVSWLDDDSELDIKIDAGQLMIRSPNRMERYECVTDAPAGTDDWIPTGDLVETRKDRVFFVGRRGDQINVGGNKVSPNRVENVIREVAGVADVRVYSVSSSLAGQLVAAELVLAEGTDEQAVRSRVAECCRAVLAAHEVPRALNVVPRIALTAAGKKSRQGK